MPYDSIVGRTRLPGGILSPCTARRQTLRGEFSPALHRSSPNLRPPNESPWYMFTSTNAKPVFPTIEHLPPSLSTSESHSDMMMGYARCRYATSPAIRSDESCDGGAAGCTSRGVLAPELTRGLQRTSIAEYVCPRARASRAVREVRWAALRCGSAAPRACMASRRIFSSSSCLGLLSVLLELVLLRVLIELARLSLLVS